MAARVGAVLPLTRLRSSIRARVDGDETALDVLLDVLQENGPCAFIKTWTLSETTTGLRPGSSGSLVT